MLRYKYCTHQRINSRNIARLPKSPMWKGLKKGEDIFKQGVKWIPGQGSNLNFWTDSWSDFGPIRSSIQGPFTLETANLKLYEVRTPTGWNWASLPFVFPPDLKEVIQAVPIPLFFKNSDQMAWKYSPKGSLDMKSAYLLASNLLGAETFSGN